MLYLKYEASSARKRKGKKNNKRVVYNKRSGKPFIMTEKKTGDYIKDAVIQLKQQISG